MAGLGPERQEEPGASSARKQMRSPENKQTESQRCVGRLQEPTGKSAHGQNWNDLSNKLNRKSIGL